jgi:very-short-patch-repair endonuclease
VLPPARDSAHAPRSPDHAEPNALARRNRRRPGGHRRWRHSNLEYRYVRDVERAHGLPKAKRQARMSRGPSLRRSQYLDNLYELFGVAVELDGAAHHLAEDRWRDIRKDNVSAASGIVTLRFSWADVTRRGCAVAAGVAGALQQRGWEGQPSRCGAACTLLIE